MTKYIALEHYLHAQRQEFFILTIEEIEHILGFTLTCNQKKERSNWYNCGSGSIGDAFGRCGYKVTPDLEHGKIFVKKTINIKPVECKAFNVTFKTSKSQKLSIESLLLKDRGMETDIYFGDFFNDNRFLLADRDESTNFFKNVIKEASERSIGKRKSTFERMIRFSERALSTIETATQKDIKTARKVFYEVKFPNKEVTFSEFVNKIPQLMEDMKSDYDFTYSWCMPRFSDSYLIKRDEQLKRNYEINMRHFESLDAIDFNNSLETFIKTCDLKYANNEREKIFEVFDLDDERLKYPGYYILVLDEYKQAYIGRASNIRRRIIDHWTRILPYNQRLFGPVETSKLSIDSFGSQDVTRIFAMIDMMAMDELWSKETELIDLFPNKYTSNRITGGLLDYDLDVTSKAKKLNE